MSFATALLDKKFHSNKKYFISHFKTGAKYLVVQIEFLGWEMDPSRPLFQGENFPGGKRLCFREI